MLKRFAGLGVLGVIATIAAYQKWDFKLSAESAPFEIEAPGRIVAQWQAMDLMDRSVTQHSSPDSWAAGAFIGTQALNTSLDVFEGSRLEYIPKDKFLSGTTIVLNKVEIRPRLGRLEADLSFSARQGGLVLDLSATALVSYQGTERANDDTVNALLRIDPVAVRPAAGFGSFKLKLSDFWARLGPDLAVAFADPRMFVARIPLPDTVRATLKLNREATESVGENAKITYVATLPESTISRRVSYSGPLILANGLWLFGSMSDTGSGILKINNPPSMESSVLEQAIQKLEESLTRKTVDYAEVSSDAISVRVGNEILYEITKEIWALPEDKRRMDVKSIRREGRLVEKKWRDNLLGDGGVFAELSGDGALKGSVQFGKPSITWGGNGVAIMLPATVKSEASVHIHFDPLIGGGAGTTVGINGGGETNIAASAVPLLLAKDDLRAALLQVDLQCKLVEASIESDGRLKVDLGWTRIPSIGAKLQVPIGREAMAPTLLFDGRPQFVQFPVIGSDEKEATAKPWRFVPAHRAVKMALVPVEANGDTKGFLFTAKPFISPLPVDDTPASLDAARQAVAAEASVYAARVSEAVKAQTPRKNCSINPSFAVLLGGVEFGSQNEIVKFARNAWHDMTKGPGPNNELRKLIEGAADIVDHPLKEAEKSAKKVIEKPVDAVRDFGKQFFRRFH